MTGDQHAFVTRFVDTWNTHDPEAISLLYREDAVMEDSGLFAGRLQGREAIRRYYVGQWQQTPEGRESVLATAANDRQIFVHWQWDPGGGREFSVRGVSIWTMRDGAIENDLTYFNPTEMREQGLVPEFVDAGAAGVEGG